MHLVGEQQWREPQVDRDTASLLLLPAVGVDPGERLDERRLAVVDVPGGADYEAADGAGAGAGAGGGAGAEVAAGGGDDHPGRCQKSRGGGVVGFPERWPSKRAAR